MKLFIIIVGYISVCIIFWALFTFIENKDAINSPEDIFVYLDEEDIVPCIIWPLSLVIILIAFIVYLVYSISLFITNKIKNKKEETEI